jgi:hypothetical protein
MLMPVEAHRDLAIERVIAVNVGREHIDIPGGEVLSDRRNAFIC